MNTNNQTLFESHTNNLKQYNNVPHNNVRINTNYDNDIVIVSLTSIKKRYASGILQRTLNSLIQMEGKYKIVINVSKDGFLLDDGFTDDDINNLKNEYKDIEINIVKNYGPLRKIIPTLQKYKNSIIITVDDDIIYDKMLVNEYLSKYKEHNCVIACQCRYLEFNSNAYKKLTDHINEKRCVKSINLVPEGFGAILYHSSWFDNSFIYFDYLTLDIEYLKNDDLILKANSYIKNIPVCNVIINVKNYQIEGLWKNYNSCYKIDIKKYINLIDTIHTPFPV